MDLGWEHWQGEREKKKRTWSRSEGRRNRLDLLGEGGVGRQKGVQFPKLEIEGV